MPKRTAGRERPSRSPAFGLSFTPRIVACDRTGEVDRDGGNRHRSARRHPQARHELDRTFVQLGRDGGFVEALGLQQLADLTWRSAIQAAELVFGHALVACPARNLE